MKQGDWEENRANDEGLREARLPFSNWGGHFSHWCRAGKVSKSDQSGHETRVNGLCHSIGY